jgi:RHS repeat-associated protein
LYHRSSGLNLTLFRAYDSDLGRWISRDPIGERGGLNLYGYVGGNPISVIDPFGLWNAEVYGGSGLAGYISFGYNNSHFSFRVGVGVGKGFNVMFDMRNKGSDGGLAQGAYEGGFIGKLDLSAVLAGAGAAGEFSAAKDNCNNSQTTAKIGGSFNFLALQKAGEVGRQTNPNTDQWQTVMDSSFPAVLPDLDAYTNKPLPNNVGIGGLFAVFFGRQ